MESGKIPRREAEMPALVGFLASLHEKQDMNLQVQITQGVEMGRPSSLEVGAIKRNGKIESIYVAGRCVEMMRGELEV